MGVIDLKIEVANRSHPQKTIRLRFLSDSDAVYSVVPKKVLKHLGVKPVRTETVTLADGSEIVREKEIAYFGYKTRVGGSDLIFDKNSDSILLGALTLEALGLRLDPLKGKPTPIPMGLGKLATSISLL